MVFKVYVDTSVIGGCIDPEFAETSNRLFDLFRAGEMLLVLSDLTLAELKSAPPEVKAVINSIPEKYTEFMGLSLESEDLARAYVSAGVVEEKLIADALHIAIATVSLVDVLVSWNFKHIVNYRKIRSFNGVNLIKGYRELEIRTPREVLSE